MNVSAKTKTQLEEMLHQLISRCPSMQQTPEFSDLYIMVRQPSGELCVYDDDERELCRHVISEWRDADIEDVAAALQDFLAEQRQSIDAINLLRPYSFVLIDESHEVLHELYLVDDDTFLIPGELMEGLTEDLNSFLKELMNE